MDLDDLAALLPLALGHDQEASACPWVELTRRTTDYPSRKAQAALAVARGALPVTPDVVDLLYRCDDCGRCRAWSTLAAPPDLPRALWRVRAALVAAGAVPEVAALAELHRAHGSIHGDLRPALTGLGPGDAGADVLFVPGTATLDHAPEAAAAALRLARLVVGRVDVQHDLLDSGQVLWELGLAQDGRAVRERLRRRVGEAGYRLILAGTPKEAFGLREALTGTSVEVRSVAGAVATAAIGGHLPLPSADVEGAVVFHPSETLLHRLDEFDEIDRWLATWLGARYRKEHDPRRNAWPAAIERPAVRVPSDLARALAVRRLAQLMAAPAPGGPSGERAVVLTCDPFSLRALRSVAPAEVEVVDLLAFTARLVGRGAAAGG